MSCMSELIESRLVAKREEYLKDKPLSFLRAVINAQTSQLYVTQSIISIRKQKHLKLVHNPHNFA